MVTEMQSRKVSVIIPVYNASASIAKCLDSVLAQEYTDVEILAINDGSTDDSLGILRDYEAKHGIRVVDQANMGVARTRNSAIGLATGEYLTFLDDDDYLDADFLATYMHSFDQDYDIVIGGWRRRDEAGRLIYERRMHGFEWETYINIYAWCKVYKRDFLVRNAVQFLDYGIGEDMYFTFSAKACQPRVKLIDYVGYTWTDNRSSVSNTSHKGFNPNLDVLHLLESIKSKFNEPPAMLAYYFRRFLVWYLLYSGRRATSTAFVAEYRRVFSWLRANRETRPLTPFSPQLREEKLFERLSVLVVSVIGRLHLVSLFAALYCRGH